MESHLLTRRRGRRRQWAWVLGVAVWAAWGAQEGYAAPYPRADSPEETDMAPLRPSVSSIGSSSGNALGMLVLSGSPRSPIVVVAGGRGSTAEDIMKYYFPVIMAEMEAQVSTRDPSIIRVQGCRPGFNQDPLGACRPVFVPRAYLPRTSTRPNRQANIASLLPIRPRPRVTRPQPQTQRDLIRQFNTSRRRPSWFGKSLPAPQKVTKQNGPAVSANEIDSPEIDSPEISVEVPGDVTSATTTTTTDATIDCDD